MGDGVRFAFGELGASILVSPPGESTLPIRIYTIIANAPASVVAALALLQLMVILVPLALGRSLRLEGATHDGIPGGSTVTKRRRAPSGCRRVSLAVRAGESVVIVGPSGSGKTTLLRIVAGLDAPDEGEVWLEGRRVSASQRLVVPSHERRLSMVFQDLALWPHMTIEQHLEFVLKAAGVPVSERVGRARTR